MEKETDGVWRTIRGRRIFIASGESLGQAMSKSGKFKNLTRTKLGETRGQLRQEDRLNKRQKYWDKEQKATTKEKFNALRNKAERDYNKLRARDKDEIEYRGANQAEKNRINESSKRWIGGKTRVEKNYFRYSQEDRRELSHEKIQKKIADYKAKKENENRVKSDYDDARKKLDNLEYEYARIGGGTKENLQKYNEQKEHVDYLKQQVESFKAKKQSNNHVESDYANGVKLLKTKENEKGTYIEDLTNRYNELARQGKGKSDTFKSLKKEIADLRKQSNNHVEKQEKSWLSQKDSDWLKKQGHSEKLDKLASNYNSRGDIETDERNLNNIASDYFYNKAGIYNENIDSTATKWAHDKAVELNKQSNNKIDDNDIVNDDNQAISYSFRTNKRDMFTIRYDRTGNNKNMDFATTASTFNRKRTDYERGGQAQKDILKEGTKARAFYDKWDKKHLGTLTQKEYKELVNDIEDLKKEYPYIQGDRFYDQVELDRSTKDKKAKIDAYKKRKGK